MKQKVIEGRYLGKYPIKGTIVNVWNTINMNNAYRVQLLEPQYFLGYIHDEVILFDEDILSFDLNKNNTDN